MAKALALFSGGLDSLLAARVVMEQGVEVLALHFITPFFNYGKKGREAEAAAEFEAKYGIKALIIDITDEYVPMVRNPRYGYGKNFNPCIDCKIFMMGKARALMAEHGADFLVSGEVLGQRPMSQRKDALRTVERESGAEGYLLRPLCAKLLKPTIPEERGLVDRERLLDISGRARRRQMDLAEALGIKEYQTPAGGCLLTDPIISKRIQRFLTENETVDGADVALLAVGRHFRLPGGMLYVGRNNEDNKKLAALSKDGDRLLKTKGVPGPLGLYRGEGTDGDLALAAGVTARYSDAKGMAEAAVGVTLKGGGETLVTVAPMAEAGLEVLRASY